MIRLVVATLLLAAIAVTVRLKARGTGPARSIKVTSRAAINRGAVIAVVEAEGRRLLIGAAANQVNVLADLGTVADTDEVKVPVSVTVPAPALTRPKATASVVDRIKHATARTAEPALRFERTRRRA